MITLKDVTPKQFFGMVLLGIVASLLLVPLILIMAAGAVLLPFFYVGALLADMLGSGGTTVEEES